MKMAAFTQIYGDEGELEIQLMKYDTLGRYVRNLCHEIVFSFHICSESFIKKVRPIITKLYPNVIFIYYPCMTYLKSFQETLLKMRENGIDDVLNINLDVYGFNALFNFKNITHIDDIVEEYKMRPDIKWLNVYGPVSLHHKNKINKVDFYTSMELNSEAFAANVDFLLNILNTDLPSEAMTLKCVLKDVPFDCWGVKNVIFKKINMTNLSQFFDIENINHLIK